MKVIAELPPCPRCGGAGEIVKVFPRNREDSFVRCPRCGAETKCYTSRQNARKAWSEGRFDGGKDE